MGYSFADAFLADLLGEIYRRTPHLLAGNKRLPDDTVGSTGDYENAVTRMVDKKVRKIMYGGLADVARHFKDELTIYWPESELGEIVTASLIRNCIIHNNSIVDDRIAKRPDWNFGDQIALSDSDAHSFGIAARSAVQHIYYEAETRYLLRDTLGRIC